MCAADAAESIHPVISADHLTHTDREGGRGTRAQNTHRPPPPGNSSPYRSDPGDPGGEELHREDQEEEMEEEKKRRQEGHMQVDPR